MTNEADKEESIRLRAYFIWIAEGCPERRDVQHWELAKALIKHEDRERDEYMKYIDKPPPGPSMGP